MYPVSSLLILGSLATIALAQSSSLDLFVNGNSNQKFVGSIVAADCSQTTVALRCTAGVAGVAAFNSTCNGQTEETAVYSGSDQFMVSTTLSPDGDHLSMGETCTIKTTGGTPEATCSATVSLSVSGFSTASTSAPTLVGSEVNFYQIPITAGGSLLPSSMCSTKSPAHTLAADPYKVMIVHGAAVAVLAGAGLL